MAAPHPQELSHRFSARSIPVGRCVRRRIRLRSRARLPCLRCWLSLRFPATSYSSRIRMPTPPSARAHSDRKGRARGDSVAIESETPMPSVLAELALPRNLVFKSNKNANAPVGTGPFLVAEWQPGRLLKLAANEESWRGRPFVNAIEIEFGKSLRDQALAFELGKTDVIEAAPQAPNGAPQRPATSSSIFLSLPVELLDRKSTRLNSSHLGISY